MKPTNAFYRLILLPALLMLALSLLLYTSWERTASASAEKTMKRSIAKPIRTQQLSAAEGGAWSQLFPLKTVPVHISLLPDGRLLYWGRDKASDGFDTQNMSKTYLMDPLYPELNPGDTQKEFTNTIDNQTTNLFCSGHSFLPDGRLLVTGGHRKAPPPHNFVEGIGEEDINIFNYRTQSWAPAPLQQMGNGRWYPYNVTLADGETAIMSGTYWTGQFRQDTTTGATLPEIKSNKNPNIRDLQRGLATLEGDSNNPILMNYPYIFLAPDGKIFVAGPRRSRLLDPFATNIAGTGRFTDLPSPAEPHIEGSAVMYAPGKVLMLGGYSQTVGALPTNVAESIDLNQANPSWTKVGPMANARHYPTATLLPDGKVLVTGGTTCAGGNNLDCGGPNQAFGGAVQTPELWDPANPHAWVPMNSTNSGVPRVYHSIALLMPDARVMVGGGGLPAATGETGTNGVRCIQQAEATNNCRHFGHNNAEYFSPPYLFNENGTPARRPAISSAPASIAYGQSFSLGIGNVNAEDIKEVVLVRLPSVTHTYNQDQRRVVLSHTGVAGAATISVTGPVDGKSCPPGPYMMFLIRNNGRNTPSVARIVRVGKFSIDRNSQTFPATAQQGITLTGGNFNVTAVAGLNWEAVVTSPNSSWVTITLGASGTGNGTVQFSVSPNTASGAIVRKATISIRVPGHDDQGIPFEVHQGINLDDIGHLSPAAWAAVNNIFARGVTSGCGGNNYCPGGSVTRWQTANFLTSVLKPASNPKPNEQRYTDVPLDDPGIRSVEYIGRRAITSGCGPKLFCPNSIFTRKMMAVWLMNALGVDDPPLPTTATFDDVPLSDPACRFVEELVRRNITAGCGLKTFCPDQPLTREQMAVFIVSAFGL